MKDRKDLLHTVIEACEDRKAENIVVLNMEGINPLADYFVISHGSNERQVQAIARSVKDAVEINGFEVKRMEGFEQARWILIDLGDLICHVFHEEERNYYNLERLWGDAQRIQLGDDQR